MLAALPPSFCHTVMGFCAGHGQLSTEAGKSCPLRLKLEARRQGAKFPPLNIAPPFVPNCGEPLLHAPPLLSLPGFKQRSPGEATGPSDWQANIPRLLPGFFIAVMLSASALRYAGMAVRTGF